MQSKKVFTAEFFILVILAAACICMFCLAIPLDIETRMFPQIISVITFLFSMYAIAARLLGKAAAGKDKSGEKGIKHLLFVGISFVYVLLLTPLGFIIDSIALFVAMPVVLGNKKFKLIIPTAIIATVIFYVVFKKLFFVNLPQGPLTFI
jgi:putative tricarboxylic transport membrane protein